MILILCCAFDMVSFLVNLCALPQNNSAAVPCTTAPRSFRNPECTSWPKLALQEKKKAKPLPFTYAARQVLAAQDNNLHRDAVKAGTTSSFYGTLAEDADDDFESGGRFWTPHGNR
jgi:hypothetical protein